MFDAVLLDWEGVLALTGGARREAMLRALADEGMPWTSAAYDARCAGLDVRAAAAAALGGMGRDDPALIDLVALRAGRDFAAALAHGFSLVPGATEFIAAVEHRCRVAIVTRAARAETEVALRLSGLDSSVAAVVTADDVLEPPPAPESFARALAQLSRRRAVHASRVVAIVDSSVALRAARAAGLRTLAVGAPAHVAVEADGAVDELRGLTLDEADALTGAIAPAEHG
jgi:beta-phosphoglucomutase-like phosphatase (HAD superfamily)